MYQVEIENTVEDKIKDGNVWVDKTQQQIDLEKLALVSSKENEIQSKVDAYIAAQQAQLQNGGPGPVADIEIMKIVNEHNGQFEVVFKEAGK